MAGSQKKRDRRERFEALVGNPETLRDICDSIVTGGTLNEWCKQHDVPYTDVYPWIAAEDHRREKFDMAVELRGEFLSDLVVRNLRMFADLDIAKFYDEHGNLLPIDAMPEENRRAIVQFEVNIEAVETADPGPRGGSLRRRRRPNQEDDEESNDAPELVQTRTHKIKTISPERAIELLGKYRKMFVDKVEVAASMKLEDLVGASMKPAE